MSGLEIALAGSGWAAAFFTAIWWRFTTASLGDERLATVDAEALRDVAQLGNSQLNKKVAAQLKVIQQKEKEIAHWQRRLMEAGGGPASVWPGGVSSDANADGDGTNPVPGDPSSPD